MIRDPAFNHSPSHPSTPVRDSSGPTLADFVVATLRASGVRRIYGLPGDSLNGLTDAIRRDGEMTWLHVRHEEAAAFAAAGEAAVTGGLAVCAASCGPGNLHLINGLYDAQRSRVPVLALAAHIPLSEVGSGYFQETHPAASCSASAASMSSWSASPSSCRASCAPRCAAPSNAAASPSSSFRARSSRTRPPHATAVTAIRASTPVIRPSGNEIEAAADLLNATGAVTILAGAGCEGAHGELLAIAERLKPPSCTRCAARSSSSTTIPTTSA